jgi:hypothetical protein
MVNTKVVVDDLMYMFVDDKFFISSFYGLEHFFTFIYFEIQIFEFFKQSQWRHILHQIKL